MTLFTNPTSSRASIKVIITLFVALFLYSQFTPASQITLEPQCYKSHQVDDNDSDDNLASALLLKSSFNAFEFPVNFYLKHQPSRTVVIASQRAPPVYSFNLI